MKSAILKQWFSRILDLLGISSSARESSQSGPTPDPEQNQSPDPNVPAVSAIVEPEDDQQLSDEPEIIALDDEAKAKLKKIRKYASWTGEEGEQTLAQLRESFAAAYPGHESEIATAIQQGRALREICERAYQASASQGENSPQVAEVRREAQKDHSWNLEKFNKAIRQGNASFLRRKSQKNRRKQPRKPMKPRRSSQVAPMLDTKIIAASPSPYAVPDGLHGSDLRAQKPAQQWTVVIDESGSEFGAGAETFPAKKQGRFVAVVIPGNPPALPPLPKSWHAADCTDDLEIDRVFQQVLSAAVAVFGVTVSSLPVTPGERWADGVAMLVDWILRLLPVDGPTRLEVLIENRGNFQRGDQWPLIERDCIRRLALAFPKTAGWIDLRIKVVGKDDCDLGGYADAVAFTWARTSPTSKDRMEESLLANSCLLEVDSRMLLGAWDSFAKGVRLPGSDWWNLLPLASTPASLSATLLERLGHECQGTPALWSVYLDETRLQMAGGAVDLRRLADATAWLERFLPEEQTIPPLMRLAWLVVKLARSNHYGDAESAWEEELRALAPTLVDEAAPMVCHADLHLAVARTNRFDFDGAKRALELWLSLPVSVPGLRYWAQVRSSFGQHAAFMGDNVLAVNLFDEALEAFGRLSDPAVRAKEAAQTGAYRAIALMDQPEAPKEKVRNAVKMITGPIEKAIPSLATSDSPALRYAHHILLRWMVACSEPLEKEAYLAHRMSWKSGQGHPWPLIELYRALLLHPTDPTTAREHALKASEIAFSSEQGPVVRLIGACCRVVAVSWGSPWPEASSEFEELNITLPAARDRIVILQEALSDPLPPLELLSQVLPFNFR